MKATEAIAHEIVGEYVQWLNMWTADDKRKYPETSGHTYHTDQFMVHDPDRGLYGDYTIRSIHDTSASTAFPRVLVDMSIHDGDEGGPTDLYAWFEKDEVNNPDAEYKLVALVQGFDTNLQFIMEEGKWKNTPE